MGEDEFQVVFPAAGVPGALAVVCKVRNAPRFRALQAVGAPAVYRVEAVVGSHVPLTGRLDDLVRSMPTNSLSVADPPLPIYVHHGGHDAVYLDLLSTTGGPLSGIGLNVDADSPFAAFAGARSAVNELLDVLIRSLWMPVVLVRLDLFVSGESEPVAHQLHLPFVGDLRIGPLGGFHQYPLFTQIESLAREAICSTSPYYRLLCAHRLYDGIGALRGKLRQMCTDLSIDVSLPKDPKVDRQVLVAMGLGGLTESNIRTVSDLHGKMTDLRNSVAHFLLTKGKPTAPLHTSDGISYHVYSCAAAVLLHYGVAALQELSAFFQQHLNGRLSRGSVLPMVAHGDRYRVVARMPPMPRENGAT
ncbi:MAG: hypothetical protein F9K36_02755 [Burkholderiaceae bacterium]|nr:MAG: hypothetical protein F9K36_02755 [Burkholderiaceae bacterium]